MTPNDLAKSGTEHAHQTAFFAYCAFARVHGFEHADRWTVPIDKHCCIPVPALEWIYAIHNEGHGDAIRGARSKAAGVRKGVADIFLPYPTKHYYGLYIEMKRPDYRRSSQGGLSPSQISFGHYAMRVGYGWLPCYGWRHAADTVRAYIEYSPPSDAHQ